ncbi:MAG TPA: GTP 3',8-cyclase MoaA [Candidatus Poseidoniales archaeon]|nr:MAG TPA: GTP 3',8-cyclase MoaA [Candidatus Poseidoniales archaeon]
MIRDTRGRPLEYLRISMTDRCNLRCRYCMPKEYFDSKYQFLQRDAILSYEEITTIVDALLSLGLKKVRLTGGEPLIRRNVETLIRFLQPKVEVCMTTNGILLNEKAQDLWQSGLRNITISLDAVDQATFQHMSDSKIDVNKILSGIELCLSMGFRLKLNTVIQKRINEHAVNDIIDLFSGRVDEIRFIEYMDVGETNGWNLHDVVTGSEIRKKLGNLKKLENQDQSQVATKYELDGQIIGFIESVSKPFCSTCNRARLSADGNLYTCLFASKGNDLKSLLRMGANQGEIRKAVETIWSKRTDAYSEQRGEESKPKVEMSFIGG